MNLLFLGTSSGVPTKSRNVTGIALRASEGKSWCLVDCGEGTQHQLLHTNLSLHTLQAIFITHVHGDHCYGLPGILASAGMGGRRDPLKVIAPKGIKEWFASTQENTQLFLPFELEFICSDTLPEVEFQNMRVTITKLSHRVPSYAYSFVERNVGSRLDVEKLRLDGVPQGPLWSKIKKGVDIELDGKTINSNEYLIYDTKPRKIVIAGDNDRPDLLSQACDGSYVLVHEATYTQDMAEKVGEGVGHSYAKLVAQFAQSIELPHLVLTHFSPRYQSNTEISPSIMDIYMGAKSAYCGGLYMAGDFSEYKLDKSGEFTQIEGESNSLTKTNGDSLQPAPPARMRKKTCRNACC